jgi:hypothetical protein
MPIRSFTESGALGPEAIAATSEAFESALKELPNTARPDVAREVIAGRIIAEAKLGERDPARLMAAAVRIDKVAAEPIPTSAGDRLEALGQLLYGEHWITPMARDLRVCQDAMMDWASGKRELSPDHSIFAALAVLVPYHDKGTARAREIMDRNRV